MMLFASLGQRQISQYMARTGFSHAQMMTIGRLYVHGGVGISEMSAHMGTTDAAASQLIDRMVNQGLVERKECPADRRKKEVVLSAKGRAVIDSMSNQRAQMVDAILKEIPAEKEPVITEALNLLLEAAHKVESQMDFEIPRGSSQMPSEIDKDAAPVLPLSSF
jgi:DNA-binding MarR family transcriptional regulator